MPAHLKLAFGKDGAGIELPAGFEYIVLDAKSVAALPDRTAAIEQALDRPISSPSLIDLARDKTSAAISRFRSVRKPYISVLLHPTTGGVAASFAWLGDVVLAEPKALIGFAGPRVIEQTVRQKLPEGFQRSEFLLEHGMVDAIVPRRELRMRLGSLLSLMD